MGDFDFDLVRSGRPGCPSDVKLWRLSLGEPGDADTPATEGHVAGCPLCQDRMAQWRAGLDAFPGADPVRMLASIQRRVRTPVPAWRRALRYAVAPLIVAGAVGVLLVARPNRPDEVTGGAVLHRKGGPVLHVFREASGAAHELSSGERFQPDDRLSFTVDTPEPARLELIGIEATGRLYGVWPAGDTTVLMSPGRGQHLPAAVELDSSRGIETLYLVSCPIGVEHAECASRGGTTPPVCHAGCTPQPFTLDKGP